HRRVEAIDFGIRGRERVEGVRVSALGEARRPLRQFDASRTVADAILAGGAQNPAGPFQQEDIVWTEGQRRLERLRGCRDIPAGREGLAEIAVRAHVVRLDGDRTPNVKDALV